MKYKDIEVFCNAKLKVGDKLITKDIDGKAVFVVAELDDDKIYLVRKWLLDNSAERPLISDDFNAFEWLDGEYRMSLPKKVRSRICGKVTLPSEREVFGKNEYGKDEDTKQFRWFKTLHHRIAAFSKKDTYSIWWWTRTKANKVSASQFAFVYGAGGALDTTPSITRIGVRPHLILQRSC